MRILLSIICFSFVFQNALARIDNKAPGLDAECRSEERYAKPYEEHNAAVMMGQLLEVIEKKEKERKQEGKELNLMLVARAGGGLNPTKFNLIQNDHPLDKIVEHVEKGVIQAVEEHSNINSDNCGSFRSCANYRNKLQRLITDILNEQFSSDPALKELLVYTHMGILLRDKNAAFGWRFSHLLTPCGKGDVIGNQNGDLYVVDETKNTSRIYNDGMARFFIEEPREYKAWVLVPSDEIQNAMMDTLEATRVRDEEDELAFWKIKAPYYNIVANLKNPEEGNSNYWPLYILSAAMENNPHMDYAQAMETTLANGYLPSHLQYGGIYSFATLIDGFIPALSIRGKEQRHTRYKLLEIVTSLSIFQYMKKNNILDESFEVIVPKELIMKE